MLKRIFLVVVILFGIVFSINNSNNHTRAIVTSNYLLVRNIDKQNVTDVINSIKFHIPSVNVVTNQLNTKPYIEDGKVTLYIGNMLEGDNLLVNKDALINNYLFEGVTIMYDNETKQVDVSNPKRTADYVDAVPFNYPEGTVSYLIRIR